MQVLRQLIGSALIKHYSTMLFIKSPGDPGHAVHQDEFYIPTQDQSLASTWVSLEHADVDNGCIWYGGTAGAVLPARKH